MIKLTNDIQATVFIQQMSYSKNKDAVKIDLEKSYLNLHNYLSNEV
jgi:hypothetical protein